ncbi:hypothetical protein [Methylorubrum extorquens]|uniref:hypothetical protein n=1 Tax=Methylorubrum extorquens TaxID=408 RepID=UPI0002E1EDE7|nr:hypothetical protein [Methylorubrum extorquens]MCP1544569.1 hypothetical protein [Methylorubrum extorquens]MCP1588084.1 hypothetical protein [Methylorubrum extorquens]
MSNPKPKPSPEMEKAILEGVASRSGEINLLERLGMTTPDKEAGTEAQRLRKKRIAQQAREMAEK